MSRKFAVLFLTMVVLAGAMGLRTLVGCHNSGAVMMANGGGIPPPIKR